MNKRILVAVPAAPTGVHDLTIQSLRALSWDGPLDYLVLRCDEPERDHHNDLALKLNRAREWALLDNYAAMLVVEADMIVPEHALRRLWAVRGADIVYGLYCSRRPHHKWLAFSSIDEDGTGEQLTGEWGKVVPSAGVGTGCTLLRSKALESVIFRTETHPPDWYLAMDAASAGLRQKHDLGVVCGHIVDVDPLRIVWPTEEGHMVEEPGLALRSLIEPTAGKYIAVKRLTFTQQNRTVKPGEIVELTAMQAALFLPRGIVEPCPQED